MCNLPEVDIHAPAVDWQIRPLIKKPGLIPTWDSWTIMQILLTDVIILFSSDISHHTLF